jgi:hypothetical protein
MPSAPASDAAATSSGLLHGYIAPQMSGISTLAWRVRAVSSKAVREVPSVFRESDVGGRVAAYALERRPDSLAAPLEGNHPRPHLPGWIVTHVLRVAALEVSHPVILLVLMKAHDSPGNHANHA